MNKLLGIILVVVVLLPGVSSASDANKVSTTQPSEQEKSLWDKISNIEKELDTFAGKNAPRPPRLGAGVSEVNNFMKAAETYRNDLLKQIFPLLELSKEYYSKYPKGAFADDNFQLLQKLLTSIGSLNDGIFSSEVEDFYNRLCQDKNLNADPGGWPVLGKPHSFAKIY